MLVIKGKNGKSTLLVDEFIGEGDLVIETDGLRISHMSLDDIDCTYISIPSNNKENLTLILKALELSFEDTGNHFRRIIFYVNTTEDNIEMFLDFSKKHGLEHDILTVQADNEELEFYSCNR